MATQTYDTGGYANPRLGRGNNWQDWVNLILALWLFVSPWVLQFGAAMGGTDVAAHPAWNAWILGIIVFLVSLSALGRARFWQEWVNLVLGIWVFIAPWALGFAALSHAAWDHWVIGALVVLISACIVTQFGRTAARTA